MDKKTNKKPIPLNLADIETTAKICRILSSETRLEILRRLVNQPMTIGQIAKEFYLPMSSVSLHIKLLHEAGLISIVANPGAHGTRKMCGIAASGIFLDLFAHRNIPQSQPPAYVNMPVGYYSSCEVTPPCGIATVNSCLTEDDAPHGFYSPEHVNASLLWLTRGFLEYHFPNEALHTGNVDRIEFLFEICSEAPGYNNDWPSDVQLELNHRPIVTMHLLGDYGGRRGIYNPSWWSDTSTQYGELKHVFVTNDGCYLDEQKVSRETISSLGLTDDYFFSFALKVDSSGGHAGGMNLFGKYFGDYAQDIVMKVEYKNP